MAHPRKYDESDATIQRLRRLCLALTAAFEKEAWGECTFRVAGGSMFAMTDNHHHGSEHVAVWLRATPLTQEIIVASDRDRFFVPPYVGKKGWIGVRLDFKVDWEEVADLIEAAYQLAAPKRLRALAKDAAPAGVKKAATKASAVPAAKPAAPKRTRGAAKKR